MIPMPTCYAHIGGTPGARSIYLYKECKAVDECFWSLQFSQGRYQCTAIWIQTAHWVPV